MQNSEIAFVQWDWIEGIWRHVVTMLVWLGLNLFYWPFYLASADRSWRNTYANYGRFFFEENNKNNSYSQARLDATWRNAHNQGPTAVACGATQAEAQGRLFNERAFYSQAAAKNWWWWRW